MPDIVDANDFSKTMIVLRIVWIAMLIPLAIYFFAGQYLMEKETIASFSNLPIDTLRTVLYTISLFIIVSIIYFRRFIMSRPIKQYHSVQKQKPLQHPVIAKYAKAMIISLSLAESVGTFGLVLAILGKSRIDLYVLLLLSAAVIFYYRPKSEEFSELLNIEQKA